MCTGLAVLKEIEEKDLVKTTKKKGDLLFNELYKLKNKYPHRISYVWVKA